MEIKTITVPHQIKPMAPLVTKSGKITLLPVHTATKVLRTIAEQVTKRRSDPNHQVHNFENQGFRQMTAAEWKAYEAAKEAHPQKKYPDRLNVQEIKAKVMADEIIKTESQKYGALKSEIETLKAQLAEAQAKATNGQPTQPEPTKDFILTPAMIDTADAKTLKGYCQKLGITEEYMNLRKPGLQALLTPYIKEGVAA